MAQLTIRAADELVVRVRGAAGAHGSSVNQFIVDVLDAATNPDLAGSDADRIRERLARAGLLASSRPSRTARPTSRRLAAARRAAASGTSLSELAGHDRG